MRAERERERESESMFQQLFLRFCSNCTTRDRAVQNELRLAIRSNGKNKKLEKTAEDFEAELFNLKISFGHIQSQDCDKVSPLLELKI